MSGVGRRAWGQVVLSKNPARSAISKDDLSLAPASPEPDASRGSRFTVDPSKKGKLGKLGAVSRWYHRFFRCFGPWVPTPSSQI